MHFTSSGSTFYFLKKMEIFHLSISYFFQWGSSLREKHRLYQIIIENVIETDVVAGSSKITQKEGVD